MYTYEQCRYISQISERARDAKKIQVQESIERVKETEHLPNATRSCASETTSIIRVQTSSKTMSHSMRERLPT